MVDKNVTLFTFTLGVYVQLRNTAFFFDRFSANRVFGFAETLSFFLEFWVFWLSFEFFPLEFRVFSLNYGQFYVNLAIFCLKSFWHLEKWSNFVIFLLKQPNKWCLLLKFKDSYLKFAETLSFFLELLSFFLELWVFLSLSFFQKVEKKRLA